MQKICLVLVIIFNSIFTIGQDEWADFTGKQKGFFYQLTRKIDNLNPVVFHLFEFTDSIPYINDTLPDYPYVRKMIESDSSKLILHHSELIRKNNGLVSDIAVHYAMWELDLILHFRSSDKSKYQYLKPKLKQFEHYVLEKAPQAAVQTLSDGSYVLSPTLFSYYSPNLTISEKIAAIRNVSFDDGQKYTIIKAIYYAQEKYVKNRAIEIIEILTDSQTKAGNNFMIAAGNGSNWTELESVLRTKYNRPLPDPKAFFRYDLTTVKDDKTGKKRIKVKDMHVLQMNTSKSSY